MKHLRLLGLTLLALFALTAITAATASAEDGPPMILVLPETEKVTELKFEGKQDASSKLQAKNKKTFECKGGTTTATFKEAEKKPADSNLGLGKITFTECKEGASNCRTENAKGEKDPIETWLTNVDLHLDDEESQTKVLEPLLVSTVLGVSEETPVKLNCGTLKDEIRGSFGCLLEPGLKELAAGETAAILCALEGTEGKQKTGTCKETKLLCEELAKNPLEAQLNGKFEPAGEEIHVLGTFNKMIFIND